MSRCPVSFLEQHKAFNTANLHVCELIMVILQRGKASNIPCANVEIRGAGLCVYGKPPLDSMRTQACA